MTQIHRVARWSALWLRWCNGQACNLQCLPTAHCSAQSPTRWSGRALSKRAPSATRPCLLARAAETANMGRWGSGQRRWCPARLDNVGTIRGSHWSRLFQTREPCPSLSGFPPSVTRPRNWHLPGTSSERRMSDRSNQMRIRTLVVALAVAAPLLALESRPAAAFGWCDWGWGSSSSGYSAPRSYGYYGYAPRTYGYAPRYYGGAFYGRRLGWRGYGYRGIGVGRVGGYGYRGIGVRRVGGYGYRGIGVGRVGVGRVGVGRIGRR